MELTKMQLRRFLLLRHGLVGARQFDGKEGIMSLLGRLGSIQYDPVNVCGRSPELTLLARVKNYDENMLWDLLYKDRLLLDHYDKCMCIMPREAFGYLRRMRESSSIYGRSRENIEAVIPAVMQAAAEKEYISSKDLGMNDRIDWPWGSTSIGRAAAERLYFEGRLAVHHKEGAVRFYTLPEKIGMEEYIYAEEPHKEDGDYFRWIVRRRLYSIGIMENRGGDGFLGIKGLSAAVRRQSFAELENEGCIFPVTADGKVYYIDSRDRETLEKAISPGFKTTARCELIAPLDNLMWDRKIVSHIFDFDYKWEIYTPKEKLKYGHYVLPVLYRDRLVGRIEPVADRKKKVLEVRNFWPEEGFDPSKSFRTTLMQALERLAKYNKCKEVKILCSI